MHDPLAGFARQGKFPHLPGQPVEKIRERCAKQALGSRRAVPAPQPIVVDDRQSLQAAFRQAAPVMVHWGQAAVAPLDGGRAAVELPHHPSPPPFEPASQVAVGQPRMGRIRFKGLHRLLPCLPVTLPVNRVLGLAHRVMPIHHGQQLAGQPLAGCRVHRPSRQDFPHPKPPETDVDGEGVHLGAELPQGGTGAQGALLRRDGLQCHGPFFKPGRRAALVRRGLAPPQGRGQPLADAVLLMEGVRARGTAKAFHRQLYQRLGPVADRMAHPDAPRLQPRGRPGKPGVKEASQLSWKAGSSASIWWSCVRNDSGENGAAGRPDGLSRSVFLSWPERIQGYGNPFPSPFTWRPYFNISVPA